MTITALQGIFTLIGDMYQSFQIPRTEALMEIWLTTLGDYDERIIYNAIYEIYNTEQFFSFAKLKEKLESTTQKKLPDTSEVTAIINRLATNSRQDISNQPEHIRMVIERMGGLERIGMMNPEEPWLNRDIARVYEEVKGTIRAQDEYVRLTGNDRRLLEFEQ